MTDAAQVERSDAALIAAVRRGDRGAYGLLYERHLAAAKRAATYLAGTSAEREDLVAEAFTRVLQVLVAGRGPAQEFRPYLLVTMRHAAINAARRSPATALFADVPDVYLPAVAEDPVVARLHGDEAASAFAGLPERWRVVLWHTEVEGASPAAIAPMLGMTPNGVAALAYRAREGLRQAYLRLHLPAVERQDCRAATDKLAGWVRRSISGQQRRKITAHLDRCERCREIAAGLSQVNGELRATTPFMPLLSAIKSMFAAASVKVGAAAAAAAVTAVTVVASEPSLLPDGGRSVAPRAEAPHVLGNEAEGHLRGVPGQPGGPVSQEPAERAPATGDAAAGDKGKPEAQSKKEPERAQVPADPPAAARSVDRSADRPPGKPVSKGKGTGAARSAGKANQKNK